MAVRTTQLKGEAAQGDGIVQTHARVWTMRTTLAESRPVALIAAAILAFLALIAAASDAVAIPTAVTLVALIPPALVDSIDRRLPNRLVAQAGLAGALVLALDIAVMHHVDVPSDLVGAVSGAAAVAGPLLLLHLISPAAMGFGDVKFALVLGAALGLASPIVGLFALVVACAATAAWGALTRSRTIAFGPGLLFGAVVALAATALSTPTDWNSMSPPGGAPQPTMHEEARDGP